MYGKMLVAGLVGAAVMVPSAASATFLPGTEPPVEYDCSATSAHAGVSGRCEQQLTKSVASHTDVIGAAVVTTKGASFAFSGDGASTATSSASVASSVVNVNLGLLRVRAVGARSTVHSVCGDPSNYGNDLFTGSVHVDRLVINGHVYTDLSSGTFTTPYGKVTVGATWRNYFDNSFDADEGLTKVAVLVTSGHTSVRIAASDVTVWSFPCR